MTIDENARDAAKKAARKHCVEVTGGVPLAPQANERVNAIVDAAILAYEAAKPKQEAVGYQVNFRLFGKEWVGWHTPDPVRGLLYWQTKAMQDPENAQFRFLFASPPDTAAIRGALEAAHVAMTIASELPGVAAEYDFSYALGKTTDALKESDRCNTSHTFSF